MAHNVVVVGAGQIGSIIGLLLAQTQDYRVFLADINLEHASNIDIPDSANIQLMQANLIQGDALTKLVKEHQIGTVISCLPHQKTIALAQAAHDNQLNYFDLTEDVTAMQTIQKLAEGSQQAYVPQCGLAPGFIDIVAADLIQRFDEVDSVKLRCGALPVHSSNALQYALTWSVDGLINEYGNPCFTVINKTITETKALSDLEDIQIDGATYEAFNTSGGLGSLAQTFHDKVNVMNYKTIRYPGHCEKMRFLMDDLKLNHDRSTLKKILLHAIPSTHQDVVIVYVSVHGTKKGKYVKDSFAKKYYPAIINGIDCSAIQATTASAACTMVDLVLQSNNKYHGYLRQEDFNLDDFFANRFGEYFKP